MDHTCPLLETYVTESPSSLPPNPTQPPKTSNSTYACRLLTSRGSSASQAHRPSNQGSTPAPIIGSIPYSKPAIVFDNPIFPPILQPPTSKTRRKNVKSSILSPQGLTIYRANQQWHKRPSKFSIFPRSGSTAPLFLTSSPPSLLLILRETSIPPKATQTGLDHTSTVTSKWLILLDVPFRRFSLK